MDDIEYGGRCDDCGRIFAVEDLIRDGDKFLCETCYEMPGLLRAEALMDDADDRLFEGWMERHDRGMLEPPDEF